MVPLCQFHDTMTARMFQIDIPKSTSVYYRLTYLTISQIANLVLQTRCDRLENSVDAGQDVSQT